MTQKGKKGKNEQNIIFRELQVIQNKYIYAKLRKMTGIQEISCNVDF